MKIFNVLIISLLSLSVYAMDVELKPMLGVGQRFGKSNMNDKGAFYVTGKMTTLKMNLADFKTVNFGTLGVNYQDDKNWAMSVSPISVSSMSGITIGVDYIPETKDVRGGSVGLFLAIKIP